MPPSPDVAPRAPEAAPAGPRATAGAAAGTQGGSRPGRPEARREARRLERRAERRVLLVLAVLLAGFVVLPDAGVLTPDTKPEVFIAPWRTLLHTATAWQDSPYLGAPNFNAGLAPVVAALSVIDVFGPPDWLTMRLWRLGLLLVAAAGARRLLAATSQAGPAGRVAAAVGYVATPYVLLGGGTTPTLLPYALLPWFLLAVRRGLLEPRRLLWPVVTALILTAMSGINAGVVPAFQVLAVVAVVAEVRARRQARWRDVARVLATTALVSLVLALYWLVPALAAIGTGQQIAGTTESLDVIAATSSAAESLRGLGFWTLYGEDRSGPFNPQLVALLASPLVVVASFTAPVLAAVGGLVDRTRARVLPVVLVAVGLPVMVGPHPGAGGPTPLGRVLERAFTDVSGAVAFRTTNKAGGLVVLGLALLGALAVDAGWKALGARRTPERAAGLRAAAAGGLAVLVVAGTLPAWTGGMFTTRIPVPGYWRDAAAQLDASDPVRDPGGSRVLFVPGASLARYRWGYKGPDELGNSLVDRRTVVRTTVPNGSPYAANLLAGVDRPLQDGTLDPGVLSVLARYVGASDVLVRNDTQWEISSGAPPSVVGAAVSGDPGLTLTQTFGRPGEWTRAPAAAGAPDPATDASLPPLQRFAVDGATAPTRQVPVAGSVLVDGDGEALAGLVRSGALAGDPALLLAQPTGDADVRRLLAAGTRVVLTDTNARRLLNPRTLASGTGTLLRADDETVPTIALGAAQDQSVLVDDGDTTVTADGRGLVFGPFPYGAARLAADGDDSTAWLTGNFGTGPGNALVLRRPDVTAVPSVRLVLPAGGGPRVTTARVTVTGGPAAVTRDVALPAAPARTADVDLGDARGTAVRVEITGVTDSGNGPVGFAEVRVPGWDARTATRLPERLPEALARLAAQDPAVRSALAATPVDVVLTRRRGAGVNPDEEPSLARRLTLPVSRAYDVAARVRLSPAADDAVLDGLDPRRVTSAATASSRVPGDFAARASSAVDVGPTGAPDLSTAWTPADPVVGQWLQVSGPARRLDALVVTQPVDAAGFAVRARVEVDGRVLAETTLGPGRVRVPLGVQGSRVRLTLLARGGPGAVRVSDVTVLGAGAPAPTTPPVTTGCLVVATVDGAPLTVRPLGTAGLAAGRALARGDAVDADRCPREPLRLTAGEHAVRPAGSLVVDRLDLLDTLDPPVAAAPATRTLPATLTGYGDTFRRLRTVATGAPYLVVAGAGWDAGWRATADGRDLGPPLVVDGYSAGWLVTDGAAHDVRIEYGPRRRAVAAAAVSGTALAACVVVAAVGLLRRRRTAPAAVRTVPPTARRGGRARAVLGWTLVVALAAALGGVAGGATALAAAVALGVARAGAPRVVAAAVAVLGLVPVAWVVGNADRLGDVTPQVVLGNPWPGVLATAGVVLLVVGVLRDERVLRTPPRPAPSPGAAP